MSSGTFDMKIELKAKPDCRLQVAGVLFLQKQRDEYQSVADCIHISEDGTLQFADDDGMLDSKCPPDDTYIEELAKYVEKGEIRCKHYSDQTDETEKWKYVFDGEGKVKLVEGRTKTTYDDGDEDNDD